MKIVKKQTVLINFRPNEQKAALESLNEYLSKGFVCESQHPPVTHKKTGELIDGHLYLTKEEIYETKEDSTQAD